MLGCYSWGKENTLSQGQSQTDEIIRNLGGKQSASVECCIWIKEEMSFVSEFLRESEMEKFEILDKTVLKTKLDFHQNKQAGTVMVVAS